MKPISDGLRKAIMDSGISQNALSKATGISQGRLSEFLAGGDINTENADKLAAYFGLKLSGKKPENS